jgi:hypothetical protein
MSIRLVAGFRQLGQALTPDPDPGDATMPRNVLLKTICLTAMLVTAFASQAAASPIGPPPQMPQHPHGQPDAHGHTGLFRRGNRPPVPNYQRYTPDWRFNGYYPKYEGGIHVRQLQDIGYGGGSTWWRGRPW